MQLQGSAILDREAAMVQDARSHYNVVSIVCDHQKGKAQLRAPQDLKAQGSSLQQMNRARVQLMTSQEIVNSD
jgi:hypothetical protein